MIWHGILNDANYPQIVKPIDFNIIRVHFKNSFPQTMLWKQAALRW